MAEVAKAYVSLIPSAKGFGKSISNQIGGDLDTAGKEGGKRFGSSMSSSALVGLGAAMKKGTVAAALAIAAVIGTALVKGWGRLTAIENATAKLTGLGNSAASVKSIMDNALASVKGTAFGLDEAASVAAGAVAAGIAPGKELRRILGLTADGATIAGISMGEMGAIFNKVASSNKIQGDVIAQLNDAGIPIVQLLGKTLGKTAGEVVALASKGKINFATFAKAMESGLGGAALKSGETTTGSFKNMGAAISRFGATLLTGVFPIAKTVFGGITKFLDDLGAKVGPFVQKVSGAISGLVAAFQGGGWSAVGDKIGASISASWPGTKAKLGEWLSALGSWMWGTALPGIRAQLAKWGIAFWAWIQPQIVPALTKLGILLGALGTWVLNTGVPWLGEHLKTWGIAFWAWIQPMIPPFLAELGKLLLKLYIWFQTVATPAIIKKLAEWAWAFIKWIGPMIPPLLAELSKLHLQLMIWMATKAFPAIVAQLAQWAWAFIKWIPGAALSLLIEMNKLTAKLVIWMVTTALPAIVVRIHEWEMAFLAWVGRLIVSLPGRLAGLLGVLTTWASGVPGMIVSALGDLGSLLYDKGKAAGGSVIQGLIRGIGSAVGDLARAMGNAIKTGITDLLPHSPVKKGPLRVLNRGYAGGQIVKMLAGGIDSQRSAMEASMTGLVSLPRVGSLDFASSAQRSAAVSGGVVQHIYPTPGMSEQQVGAAAARQLAWAMRGRLA